MADGIPSLHFVAKHSVYAANLKKSDIKGCLNIGNWAVSHKVAQRAVEIGAELHLHEARDQESWKAGTIVRWSESTAYPGRVIFTFAVNAALERKQLSGWAQEKAYVGLGRD